MARHRQARAVAVMVAGMALGAATAADAQTAQRGAPQPNTDRIVVVNFRGPDKAAGVKAADAVRERLMREFNARDLWVITKKDIDANLENAGYPTDEPLSQSDANALARQLRATTYVDGSVTPVQGQFRVDARLVLGRGPVFVQPLPAQTVGDPADAGQAIARAVKEVRGHLEEEQECYNNAAQQKYAEARAAAARAIQEYPRTAIARVCLLNVLAAQEASPDSILALAEEVLAIDPRSRAALPHKYNAQVALNQTDAANNTLTSWLAADPGNTDLQNRVVNQLAASGKYDTAAVIITEALAENEGDLDLTRTAFLVYQAAQRWPDAIRTGETLAQIDTGVDRQYFLRLANAYVKSEQPQKAAETIARGTQKFPQDPELLVGAAGIYRDAGQLQQATETLRRGLAINPRTPQANLVLAQLYADQTMLDSAFTALQAAQAAGDSARLVGGVAAGIAQKALEAGQASQSRDDYLRALRFGQLADQIDARNEYKFLTGAAAFQAGILELQAAQSSKSCDMARAAKEHLDIVQATIPVAGSVNPQAASQIMSTTQDYVKYPPQMIQQFCR